MCQLLKMFWGCHRNMQFALLSFVGINLLLQCSLATGMSSLLFPFGEDANDFSMQRFDDGAVPVQLQPFPYFGSTETALFVNTNGLISFQRAYVDWTPQPFPLDSIVPLIAPFWDDVDIQQSGAIYYRETANSTILERARNLIQGTFTTAANFMPTNVFIATWDHVPEFNEGSEAENTFQIVLVTDGHMSFVLFIYGEIQWGFANVGFNAGDGTRFFMVPGALTADTINIETDSNVGLPGLYVYRVDLIEVLGPDDVTIPVRFEEKLYTVDEDSGSFEVCIISEGDETVTVVIESANASVNQALGGTDYTIINHILRITPSGRECVDIAIIDDEITERREQFLVVLNSTQISRVIIEDNDDLLLTLEQDSYTASEADTFIEVCVAALNGDCSQKATATVFTEEYTATAQVDFIVTNQELHLARDSRQCVHIRILNDAIPEYPQEQFSIKLITHSDHTRLGTNEATVVIADDDDPGACMTQCQNGNYIFPGVCDCEPGWTGFACDIALPCPLLTAPDHGTIECIPPSQTVGSNCTLSCDDGYTLNGSASLLCQISATWTGEVPSCDPKLCEPLEPPQNGAIVPPCNRVFTTSCTIQCMEGYRIDGLAQQRCVSDPESGELVWTDPPVCDDDNECELGLQNCTNGAECVNTAGGFRCSCDDLSGFKLNKTDYASCEDINECETRAHNCSDRGDAPVQCINTLGGFVCSCSIGFRFNSRDATCRDSNECREGISGCNHGCRNTIGSFTCSCFRGYALNVINLRICEDINECLENNGGCVSPARCVNLPGRHECECPRGYSSGRDRRGCEATDFNLMIPCGGPGGCATFHAPHFMFNVPCSTFQSKVEQALQCPQLTAPQNGSINCNPSEQQVGALCTFICDQGHDLTGSQTRICRSSATWSGQPTICEPQRCIQLTPPDNGFVLFPCTGDYSTSCTIECREGYRINGTTPFQQMCFLDPDGELRWTDPPTCVESNICEPNRCRHGGICSPFYTSSFSCNCEETGYTGPTCDTGIITVSPIPDLTQNIPSGNISISANPDQELEIFVDGGEVIVVNPQIVKITPPATIAYFNVTARQSGFLSLRYEIGGPGATNFLAPPESPAFVMEETPTGGHVEFQYFRQIYRTNPGNIFEGCCSREALFFQCPLSPPSNRVTFRAGCIWNSDGMTHSTSGLVFVANQNFTMPLSVAGVTVTTDGSLVTASLPEFQSGNCIPCKDNQPCIPDTRCTADSCCCYDFTNSDTIDFLRFNSLTFTSMLHIQSLLPLWVQRLSVRSIGIRNNAIYEYISALTSAEMISQLEGCEEIEANDEGLYLAFRYGGILEATIDLQRLFTFTEIPLCFAIDLCRHQNSPLFIQLSPVAHSVITSQFLREYTVVRGWDVTIKSIMLSSVGLPLDVMTPDTYWNGVQFFQPRVQQQHFDIVMKSKSQAFFSNYNLEIDLNFSGTAYYNYQERDGILDGALMMNVTTTIASESVSLILTNPSGLSVMTIHESQQLSEDRCTQQQEANQTGTAFKLNIRQRREQLFYRKLFFFPEETTECPVDAFMNLNDNLELQSFSFHTTCPHLILGKLTFTGMAHTIYYLGSDYTQSCLGNRSINVPDQASLVILSSLQGQRFPLGRFFTLLPDTESDSIALSVIYLREDPTPVARLHKVRVSLLESSFSTSVEVSNNNLRFMAESEIRGLYPADLIVLAPVNQTVWDRLPLSVSGVMKGGQNSFIQRLQEALDDSVREVAVGAFRRERILNQTRQRSQGQFLQLETRFNASRLEVMAANRTYQEMLSQVDDAIVTLGQVEEALTNASRTLRDLQEEINRLCEEQECEETCVSAIRCTTSYVATTIEQTGQCTYTAYEPRQRRVEPFYQRRSNWRWITKCQQVQSPGSDCNTRCQNGRQTLCYGKSVQFFGWVPIYNHRTIQVAVQRVYDCHLRIHNGTHPEQHCTEQPCAHRQPNNTCNTACQQVRQMAYNTRQDLAEILQIVDEARLQLTLARSEVSRAKVLLDAAQQKLSQITPAYESSREVNELSEVSYRMALADLEAESQILKLFQTYNRGLLTVINTTFDITIVSESPVQLPVLITYTSMHDGRIHQRTEDVDLTIPEQALRGIFRRIAKDIVDYTLLNTSRISKRSVNLHTRHRRQEAEQDENRQLLDEEYDPILLKVLPVTFIQQAIPVQFQIMTNSPQGHDECNDMLIRMGVLSTIKELIDNESNIVTGLEIRQRSATTYEVSFFLVSGNVPREDTHTITLTEIANRAVPTRIALQQSREAIESAIQQGKCAVQCETTFTAISSSLTFQQLLHICPPGYQLISNYLFCVGCEPGSYSDVTEQTRVFSGEALTERVPVCRPCPIGTYEPRVGSSQCMSCPEFYTTTSTGATSADECTVLPDVPPLAIHLINDSPVIAGNTVKVDYVLSRPATSVTCQIRRNEQQNCSSGTVAFTGFDPGVYTLRIAASNSREDRAFLRRRFEITSDPSLCILHLINDGVTVEDDQATVEFAGTGPAESFTCKLDNEPQFLCTSPVEISDIEPGKHNLGIVPSSGCRRNLHRLNIKFTV